MSEHDVRDFVLNYFFLLGARVEPCAEDVIRVELNEEQAAEMEGRMVNPWNKQANGGLVTHYFSFQPETADLYDDIECITVGSHRLHQMVLAVRKRAEVSRLWLPYQHVDGWSSNGNLGVSSVTYRPFYIFLIDVERRPNARSRELIHVAVDLVDGLPLYHIAHIVSNMQMQPGLPQGDPIKIEAPTIDIDQAFRIAYDEIITLESEKDLSWAQAEVARLNKERDRLEAFYKQKETEGHEVDKEREKRVGELERLSPGVVVRPMGLTHAHLPVRHVEGSIQYLPEHTGSRRH